MPSIGPGFRSLHAWSVTQSKRRERCHIPLSDEYGTYGTQLAALESDTPHGGVRPFHQKSTCLTRLTLGSYVVQIWSRDPRNLGKIATFPSKSASHVPSIWPGFRSLPTRPRMSYAQRCSTNLLRWLRGGLVIETLASLRSRLKDLLGPVTRKKPARIGHRNE